jgi:hypothetical protein
MGHDALKQGLASATVPQIVFPRRALKTVRAVPQNISFTRGGQHQHQQHQKHPNGCPSSTLSAWLAQSSHPFLPAHHAALLAAPAAANPPGDVCSSTAGGDEDDDLLIAAAPGCVCALDRDQDGDDEQQSREVRAMSVSGDADAPAPPPPAAAAAAFARPSPAAAGPGGAVRSSGSSPDVRAACADQRVRASTPKQPRHQQVVGSARSAADMARSADAPDQPPAKRVRFAPGPLAAAAAAAAPQPQPQPRPVGADGHFSDEGGHLAVPVRQVPLAAPEDWSHAAIMALDDILGPENAASVMR